MRHRKFTAWINRNAPEWQPTGFVANRFPADPLQPDETSSADFHFFTQKETASGGQRHAGCHEDFPPLGGSFGYLFEFIARTFIKHLKDDEGALGSIRTRMTQRLNVVSFRTFPFHHQAGKPIQLSFRTFSTLNLALRRSSNCSRVYFYSDPVSELDYAVSAVRVTYEIVRVPIAPLGGPEIKKGNGRGYCGCAHAFAQCGRL